MTAHPTKLYIVLIIGVDSMEENHDYQNASIYQITVQGNLGSDWSQWLDKMAVISPANSDVTILSGEIADQPKLRGILNKIWDLNLTIISVIKLRD